MTTTSAGSGAPKGEGGSGDWGWFSPKPYADQEPGSGSGEHEGAGEQTGESSGSRGETGRERGAESGEIRGPSRSVSAIRPVGHGPSRTFRTSAPASGEGRTTHERPAPEWEFTPQAPISTAPRVPQTPPSPDGADRPAGQPSSGDRTGTRTGSQPPSRSEPQPQAEPRPRLQAPPQPRLESQPPSSVPGTAADGGGLPPLSTLEPSSDAALIRRTMEEIEDCADAATAYFYALLFVQNPELRDYFPASMDTQRDRLFRALLTAVRLADDKSVLTQYLAGLGRGHRKYGTRPEHYPAVGECLLSALARYAPQSWSEETEEAWVRAYTEISQMMIDAADDDAQLAPAWWNAEIVTHELRTPHIAVITVRTDQPYPFRAGQYASIETPWWPRVWRHYSFASPPRSDGLLTFHVKAVPAGWVSGALVHRARPGDVLRLGPAAGAMTLDHATDSGLICLGGGTGIAPIKALVEDVAQHGRARPVEVFYGADSDHDLYDLETMLRLEREHAWLAVRPVIAARPGPAQPERIQVVRGRLPDAVRQYGPWPAYLGYLSGPPGMIRSGVAALTGAGIPSHRIRHDSLDELVGSGAGN